MSYKSKQSSTEIKHTKLEYIGLSIESLGREKWASMDKGLFKR